MAWGRRGHSRMAAGGAEGARTQVKARRKGMHSRKGQMSGVCLSELPGIGDHLYLGVTTAQFEHKMSVASWVAEICLSFMMLMTIPF